MTSDALPKMFEHGSRHSVHVLNLKTGRLRKVHDGQTVRLDGHEIPGFEHGFIEYWTTVEDASEVLLKNVSWCNDDDRHMLFMCLYCHL